jgi:hypothetical protein
VLSSLAARRGAAGDFPLRAGRRMTARAADDFETIRARLREIEAERANA